MSINFDSIRSYRDEEVPGALLKLTGEKQFMNLLSTVFPLLPKEVLKHRLLSFHTVSDFQKGMDYPFLKGLEETKTKGIKLQGLEKIDTSKSCLYISNHRDIVLDAAFFCIKLIDNNMDTVEIAIGDNLLIFPWIENLVRVNKSFIVRRGLNSREILESSRLLSSYIANAITERNQSVWLAQREGRAKDSDDRTQESLLKMLNMYGDGNFIENLCRLNIVPLSISYEYDPCDYLKAKEFQQRRDNPDFKKSPKDDLLNMQVGVMGYKGRVTYTLTECINDELTEMAGEDLSRKEEVSYTAALIDRRIHSGYVIYQSNKIAYDLLTGEKRFERDYTALERLDFEKYILLQIGKIDLEQKDEAFLRRKLLKMYANPLVNYLEAIEKR
ncbi:MAG: 1-acyl-sn-glycerol-3-phosphate acyltransferase [Prevotellaceae bacterium]|jgi:hypothetical protein|nr:1-acyl-sn-glycerol-3-phosphate acyltransferase [Prevotellaceae bacterium]